MNKRTIAILLAVVMLLTCNIYIMAQREMIAPGQPILTPPLDDFRDELLAPPIEDSSCTDRFIIKYKTGLTVQQQHQLEQGALRIAPEMSASESTLRTNVPIDAVGKANITAPKTFSTAEVTMLYPKTAVLELDVAVEPDAFVVQLERELDSEIEYIQPDYKLELQTETVILNLDLTDDGTPTPQPSVVPIPVLEPSIEPSLVPERSPEPTISSEPAISPEPIPVPTPSMPVAGVTGKGVTIAIIDTGIDTTHPDLMGRFVAGYDFVNDTTNVYNPDLGLEQAHGTHIAGTIVKTASGLNIMPLKVFENGRAYTSDIIRAIKYAETNGASIVNCSFGSTDNNQALREAMEQSDLFFVCAAGNGRLNTVETPVYPAAFGLSNTISVTSLNADFGLSYFSNYGETVDISAVGRDVESTFPGGEYGSMSGSSMAAAYVSAATTIAIEKGGADGLKNTLKAASDKLSCLQGKVNDGNKVSIENIVNGAPGQSLYVAPADDFDVLGYQPTPDENWALYYASDNLATTGGSRHTAALKADGSVWMFGDNVYGQLGQGNKTATTAPVRVVGLTSVKAISGGAYFTLALTTDGRVYAWGNGSGGQLGNGSITQNLDIPYQVAFPNNVKITAIAAGGYHSVALSEDGGVYVWGMNDYGQLGHGTASQRITMPVRLENISATRIAAGGYHTLILNRQGEVYAFGRNNFGQLGNNATSATNSNTAGYEPVKVLIPAGVSIKGLDAGFYFSAALTTEKKVYAWGSNGAGQVGQGSYTSSIATPRLVGGVDNVSAITCGNYHTLAITGNAELWGWGNNTSGQLGNGSTNNVPSPTRLLQSGVRAAGAGWLHSAIVKTDSTVWTFGDNAFGQLGDGAITKRNMPIQVMGISNVKAVAAGTGFSIALKNDGTVWAWGQNDFGQLGMYDDSYMPIAKPIQVDISNVKAIAAGGSHAMALKEDGTVWVWGECGYGQHGDGDIYGYWITQALGLTNVKAITAGREHSVALKEDGTVWAWGNNYGGQLGNGESGNDTGGCESRIPVQSSVSGVKFIAAGVDTTMAVKENGTVWKWGGGENALPIQISGLTNIKSVSLSYTHNIALQQYGIAYAWGSNYYGQLGTNNDSPTSVPVQVGTGQYIFNYHLSNINEIKAGGGYTVALAGGQVFSWGRNNDGQLGNGTNIGFSFEPVSVFGLDDVRAIDVSGDHNLAVKTDGTVWAWGSNQSGQLGDERAMMRAVPYLVSGNMNRVPGYSFNNPLEFDEDAIKGRIENISSYYGEPHWYKFTAKYSGKYIIKSFSNTFLWGGLYNTNGQFIDTEVYSNGHPNGNPDNSGDFYMECNLIKGQTYYIQTSMDGVGRYVLTIDSGAGSIVGSNSVIVSAENGEAFELYATATGITQTGTRFKITYDENALTLSNAASHRFGGATIPGVYGNIVIYPSSEGEIVLGVNTEITEGKSWSGLISILRFTPNITGETTIHIEAISGGTN